jgi:hypothetical protein
MMAKKATSHRGKAPKRSILHLMLHREHFDAIAAGKKKTEYRDNSTHWRSRLLDRVYYQIYFRNGYATRPPFMRVQCLGIRKDKLNRFAIRLGKILQIKNYNPR